MTKPDRIVGGRSGSIDRLQCNRAQVHELQQEGHISDGVWRLEIGDRRESNGDVWDKSTYVQAARSLRGSIDRDEMQCFSFQDQKVEIICDQLGCKNNFMLEKSFGQK